MLSNMNGPHTKPTFNTVEKYGSRDGTIMLIKHFRDAGYIQVDPNSDGDGVSIFWATDLGALETLAFAGRLCGLPDGESGVIFDEAYDIEDDEPAELIRALWRNPKRTVSSYMLEGTAYDLSWSEQAKRWPWSDIEHAQIGLSIRSLPRVDVEALLLATGIPSVAAAAHQTLDECAVDTPLLRQA